jgi:hypothetical protein
MNRLHAFPGIVVEELADEILLYRPTTHTAIHLNGMAAAIWKLCDGTRTINDIVDCLAAEYPDGIRPTIANEVQNAIDQLLRDGALMIGR